MNSKNLDRLDIALRVANGEQKSSIAREYNISYSTVLHICSEYGVHKRVKITEEIKAAVLQHYRIYHNIHRAARDCGISYSAARNIIQNS